MKTYTTGLKINTQAIQAKRKHPKGIFWVLLLILLTSFSSIQLYQLNEAINTLEDMREWVQYDCSNGLVDSTIAQTYLYNLEATITNLKTIK
mgnify:FL=1|tara:strand:+ start:44 stop:319 length:276 start_codon:yes stop_codon:yes gene_type:complete